MSKRTNKSKSYYRQCKSIGGNGQGIHVGDKTIDRQKSDRPGNIILKTQEREIHQIL